mgnify:CR=1 FL=1
MITAINHWWTALSHRERILVSIAGLLAAALIGWYLILLPLRDALADARTAHGAALDRHGAIAARVDVIRALETTPAGQASGAVGAPGAPVALIASQLAAEGGLTLARNDPAGDAGAAIAISAARAPALLALIGRIERVPGLRIEDLSLRRNGDGTVAMTGTVRRQR